MKAIEGENDDLKGVLRKSYNRLENATLVELLKLLSSIPGAIEGDAFGKIYEYFLGNLAMAEGFRAGEFYTPTSIVRLIVEIIEPDHGRILDPAAGWAVWSVSQRGSLRTIRGRTRPPICPSSAGEDG